MMTATLSNSDIEVARYILTFFEALVSSICAKYIAKQKNETRKIALEKDLAYGVIRTLGGS